MKKHNLLLILLLSLFLGFSGFSAWAAKPDKQIIERGKYLVQVSGCNDCHTPGYLMSEGKTPEKDWLKGDTFGWHGPWGTTYPPNLRLFVKDLSEAQWIQEAKTLKRRPPMPWFNLNKMSDDDLSAIYHFIKSLGDPGVPAPAYIPPDKQPPMPYATFPAPPPGS